jgi:hypothetical protein
VGRSDLDAIRWPAHWQTEAIDAVRPYLGTEERLRIIVADPETAIDGTVLEGNIYVEDETTLAPSGDGKTRRVGLSGAIASLVVAVPRVTRRVTGRFVRAFGMNRPRVRGGAGLAPAAGLIRSLSALGA